MNFRIGEGWDIHALVPGRKLMLGGIHIPHDKGLLGHSDADALLHAITDALLGAAALGDIGTLFPDTDASFKGADSALLLSEAARQVRAKGFAIGNVDCTVIAQSPKLAPHKAAITARIAQVLGVDLGGRSTSKPRPPKKWGRSVKARPWKRARWFCFLPKRPLELEVGRQATRAGVAQCKRAAHAAYGFVHDSQSQGRCRWLRCGRLHPGKTVWSGWQSVRGPRLARGRVPSDKPICRVRRQ